MNGNGDRLKSGIMELLKKHPEGLSMQEISLKLDVHRHTVSKYVAYLEGSGEIVVRKVGSTSLIYRTKDITPKIKGFSNIAFLLMVSLALIITTTSAYSVLAQNESNVTNISVETNQTNISIAINQSEENPIENQTNQTEENTTTVENASAEAPTQNIQQTAAPVVQATQQEFYLPQVDTRTVRETARTIIKRDLPENATSRFSVKQPLLWYKFHFDGQELDPLFITKKREPTWLDVLLESLGLYKPREEILINNIAAEVEAKIQEKEQETKAEEEVVQNETAVEQEEEPTTEEFPCDVTSETVSSQENVTSLENATENVTVNETLTEGNLTVANETNVTSVAENISSVIVPCPAANETAAVQILNETNLTTEFTNETSENIGIQNVTAINTTNETAEAQNVTAGTVNETIITNETQNATEVSNVTTIVEENVTTNATIEIEVPSNVTGETENLTAEIENITVEVQPKLEPEDVKKEFNETISNTENLRSEDAQAEIIRALQELTPVDVQNVETSYDGKNFEVKILVRDKAETMIRIVDMSDSLGVVRFYKNEAAEENRLYSTGENKFFDKISLNVGDAIIIRGEIKFLPLEFFVQLGEEVLYFKSPPFSVVPMDENMKTTKVFISQKGAKFDIDFQYPIGNIKIVGTIIPTVLNMSGIATEYKEDLIKINKTDYKSVIIGLDSNITKRLKFYDRVEVFKPAESPLLVCHDYNFQNHVCGGVWENIDTPQNIILPSELVSIYNISETSEVVVRQSVFELPSSKTEERIATTLSAFAFIVPLEGQPFSIFDFEEFREKNANLPRDFYQKTVSDLAEEDERDWKWLPSTEEGYESPRSLFVDLNSLPADSLLYSKTIILPKNSSGFFELSYYYKTNSTDSTGIVGIEVLFPDGTSDQTLATGFEPPAPEIISNDFNMTVQNASGGWKQIKARNLNPIEPSRKLRVFVGNAAPETRHHSFLIDKIAIRVAQ